MAILQECPICKKKQKLTNKLCTCGENLDRAKRSKRVRYWIQYRITGRRQRKEAVGFSLEEARAAEGKRRAQKKEGRIFDMLPEKKITFNDLAGWYFKLATVNGLSSLNRVKIGINHFNQEFGQWKVGDIKPVDLESYQAKRLKEGRAPATVDMEISLVKTMVTKGFDNDKVDGRALKAFRKTKKKLKKGSNARKRIISFEEFLLLLENSVKRHKHLKPILIVAFNTGMRSGELRGLRWAHVDKKKGFIRLPAELTKEKRSKIIPINKYVKEVLDSLPRHLQHDFVLTYYDEPLTAPWGVRKALIAACQDAGIAYGRGKSSGITFHDIRRTVKTNMVDAGIDQAHRDAILGHSQKGMDVHYIHLSEDSLKAAMAKFTSWMDAKPETAKITLNEQAQEAANLV